MSFVLLRDYFNSLNFYKNGELSRNQIGWSGVQGKKDNENSPSSVDVLHKTLNVVISRCCFAEDDKEMYQNVKRTCRAIVFAHQVYCFAALSLPLPSSLLKLPNTSYDYAVTPSNFDRYDTKKGSPFKAVVSYFGN